MRITLLTVFVSIVLVHGLGGSQLGTWTNKENVCWPKEKDFWGNLGDKIRVLAFGYNANFLSNVTTQTMFDHAGDLLEGLMLQRTDALVRGHQRSCANL